MSRAFVGISPPYCYRNTRGTRYQEIARLVVVQIFCADGGRGCVEFLAEDICEMAVARKAGVERDFSERVAGFQNLGECLPYAKPAPVLMEVYACNSAKQAAHMICRES